MPKGMADPFQWRLRLRRLCSPQHWLRQLHDKSAKAPHTSRHQTRSIWYRIAFARPRMLGLAMRMEVSDPYLSKLARLRKMPERPSPRARLRQPVLRDQGAIFGLPKQH